ncbi:hypothetical protein MMK73_004321 [Providencia rettgeri]|nr:hypothetical protein [Providencia rettgeri]
MDLSRTIIPKSDQLNFEDVQSTPITATIKSVREGSKDQPVFIDLVGYDGRPYKPSKSMRRVLIDGWGNNGHEWVGKSLTLKGDPNVKFGGVAVGGIKVHAMSDIEGDFSLMLSVSRGKRAEHRVKKLEAEKPKTNMDYLTRFNQEIDSMDSKKLDDSYEWLKKKFTGDTDSLEKLETLYKARKEDMEKANG